MQLLPAPAVPLSGGDEGLTWLPPTQKRTLRWGPDEPHAASEPTTDNLQRKCQHQQQDGRHPHPRRLQPRLLHWAALQAQDRPSC